ncbi:MAG TPA: GNAT family N-acetyltransferase [Bryobacteraceae bacterium]|nr:GNAT family N-acetyltransferase [Bryobacteraceae bacterium]
MTLLTGTRHPDISLRTATLDDAETIAGHRRSMFFDMGHRDEEQLNAMITAFGPWLREKMTSGEYLAWMATGGDGAIVAGLGMWLMDWPPHLSGPGSRRGNILNVYTVPSFRRQGIARRLMEVALDWCRTNGIRNVILQGSDEGRPLYERLGFEPTNEMRLMIG